MNDELESSGDEIASGCEVVEIRVEELQQLFNAMDASPFRERDLDPDAEEFIVEWAQEAPRGRPLALLVKVDRSRGLPEEPTALRDAVHEFFSRRAAFTRRRLRDLLRIGRISLLLGLAFLSAAVALGGLAAGAMRGQRLGELLREGLVICGWVAMWRPLEIFLYGWWPIRRLARLYDRLARMPVRLAYRPGAAPGSWHLDRPAAPNYRGTSRTPWTNRAPPKSDPVPDRGLVTPNGDAGAPGVAGGKGPGWRPGGS